MSQHSGDYEDFLRGALHAAVDSVEPAGDGLERIRARLTRPHPLPVAWLMAVCSWLARYARGGLDSVSAWLQTVPRAAARPGDAGERSGAGAGERSGDAVRQRQLDRLRLVFTVAAVTVLMAVSVSALTPFGRHVLSQAGAALNSSFSGGETAGTGEPGASGPGSGAAGGGVAGSGGAGTTNGSQGQGQPAA